MSRLDSIGCLPGGLPAAVQVAHDAGRGLACEEAGGNVPDRRGLLLEYSLPPGREPARTALPPTRGPVVAAVGELAFFAATR
jgi:hypothetical protein